MRRLPRAREQYGRHERSGVGRASVGSTRRGWRLFRLFSLRRVLRPRFQVSSDHGWVAPGPAKLGTGFLGDGDASSDSFDDEPSFVFSEGGEHVQHQPPRRGSRFDAIGYRPHLDASVAKARDRVEDIEQGARRRSRRHTTRVSPSVACSSSFQIPGRSAAFFRPEVMSERCPVFRPRLRGVSRSKLRVLSRGGDPGVAEKPNPAIMSQTRLEEG
jgi:hypothetical protein